MENRYGARLFDHHAQLLADSAISPEVADARGYVTVDTKTRLVETGIAKAARSVPGLLIPIRDVTGEIKLYQYRPDRPRLNEAGKPIKYETSAGRGLCIDVPPTMRDRMGDPGTPLWITEGARKADAAVSAGLCCVSLLGVYGWRGSNGQGGKTALADWESIALNDRDVFVAFDSDVMVKESVRQACDRLGRFVAGRGARVRMVYLPDGGGGKVGLDDYLAAGGTVESLHGLTRAWNEPPLPEPEPPPPPAARSLVDAVTVFRRWLYLEDPQPLYALAAALVANRAPGDPVWLLLVCAPSTGKTEMLSAATRLPWVVSAAKVTESSLLSGTSKKDRAKDATGGLLRQIGDFGVILAKDFTSVLAQNKDARAEALAALREVYDGRWDRPVGADGGRMLTWTGKCGLLGGVTPVIDRYAQVVSALGDRYVLLRMPDADVDAFGRAALGHGEQERTMRRELGEALAGLVEHADPGKVNRPLTEPEQARLIRLAAYTARARTGVDRDGYRREILYKPQVEGPGRLVKVYARLLGGLESIGCDQGTAWSVLTRIAVDSVPALRTDIIRELIRLDQPARTAQIATAVDVVKDTAQLHLEDLSLLKIAEYTRGADDKSPYVWTPTEWLREHWPEVPTKSTPHPLHPPEGVGGDGHFDAPDEGSTDGVPAPPYFSSVPLTCSVCHERIDPAAGDVHPSCEPREDRP